MFDNSREELAYRVGGLLYMPSFQQGIAEKIASGSIKGLTSVAFCLEDAIRSDALERAETALKAVLQDLGRIAKDSDRPLIFVRVREPRHFAHILHFFVRRTR